jgi:hypothetical protein
MPKKVPKKARRDGFQEEALPLPQLQRPSLAPIRYPIGKVGEDPSDFIKHAAKVLSDPRTSIYVDTSFLTWLTKASDESRQQFLNWARMIGDRIHVPVWSYHEYYRHHGHDTLRQDLSSKAEKLIAAATNFVGTARTIADNPLKAGFSSRAYDSDLNDMLGKINEVIGMAQQWDYHTAAKQLTSWMSERLCRSKVVFDLMNRLGDVGQTRYTQDVPPGYMDRAKQDERDKGSNKFGDLVMWEEVLAHATGAKSSAVVILTRDRKADWFAPAAIAQPEIDLLALRGGQKWNPVPAPHPTLLIELQERSLATDLVLLDNLYFGATLHQLRDAGSARLIAYALEVPSETYSDFVARAAKQAMAQPARPVGPLLSRNKSKALLSALAPLQPRDHPTAFLQAAITAVHGDPPTGLEYVSTFDRERVANLTVEEAAEFARIVCDEALTDRGQVAQSMSRQLVGILPQVQADLAGAFFAGMLSSAYFETTGIPRPVPMSTVLQDLFNLLNDPIYAPMLGVLNANLRHAGSMALFKPMPGREKLPVLLKVDVNQQRIPVVLSEIIFDQRTLTREMGPAVTNNMRRLLRGAEKVPVAGLLELVAQTYGLPLQRLEAPDAPEDGWTTIPEKLGLVGPLDLGAPPSIPAAEAYEATQPDAESPSEGDSVAAVDSDMVEAQAEWEEDHE